MSRLTDEQKTKYLENPGHCPNCGSEQIEGGSIDVEGENAYQQVSCNDCDQQWNDIYQLVGVEGVE